MSEDFSGWFHRMLEENEVADNRYPIKGMPVYRGFGMRIIKVMQRYLEDLLECDGHEPVYFPVLIPEEVLARETEHIAGFEEQVFWVTHAGGNKLDRRLALRPTSETCMYDLMSLWVRSHADLPIKIHQSVAVYRYETKHTRPLIRGREFLWNEGHTAFESREDALENIEEVKKIYLKLISDLLCVPVDVNLRPEWDKFPGAEYTLAFETLLPGGRSLQVATIHNLGQHFSKVFNIEFEDACGVKNLVWQTSYGPGFGRLLAAVMGVHKDDKGLRLPPEVAPTQVVVVPIFFKDSDKEKICSAVSAIEQSLRSQNIRFKVDWGEDRPGSKYYRWEQRGVPLRIEVGPRDVEKNQALAVRRDTGEKTALPLDNFEVGDLLDDIQDNLRVQARQSFESRFFEAESIKDLDEYLGEGIVFAGWCGQDSCAKIFETRGTILSLDKDNRRGCLVCGTDGMVIKVAKTY
ncbi:MAG: proline--tRNA ligase [Candidatus Altiarchaeales archaeon]|nr:proline--tRNA ligase [Candidatus Altiarchaeales archaeon]